MNKDNRLRLMRQLATATNYSGNAFFVMAGKAFFVYYHLSFLGKNGKMEQYEIISYIFFVRLDLEV